MCLRRSNGAPTRMHVLPQQLVTPRAYHLSIINTKQATVRNVAIVLMIKQNYIIIKLLNIKYAENFHGATLNK